MAARNLRLHLHADTNPYTAAMKAAARRSPMGTPPLAPWQRTLRTVFQALVGLAVMIPVLVSQTGLRGDQWPWLAGVLVVCAAVTRIMATPAVERLLQQVAPWLSATPKALRAPRAPRPRGDERGIGELTVIAICAVIVTVVALLWLVGFHPHH